MTASAPGLAADRCAAFFPKGRWQMVHAIHFRLADGAVGNALGVATLDGRSVTCALMTVEGLTLFAARSPDKGPLEVVRALPPFDGRAFAEGLIADVRTLFLPPAGAVSLGRLADGSELCRFIADQEITDVIPDQDGCFQLATYAPPASGADAPRRTRTLVARGCRPAGDSLIPGDATLTGHGPAGYTLKLHLLSAEPLPPANP